MDTDEQKPRAFIVKIAAIFLFAALFFNLGTARASPVKSGVFNGVPNDPDFARQWYLPQVRVGEAWQVTTGSPDVVVAVLDTGIDIYHPDLADNIWKNPGETTDGIDNDNNGYIDDVFGWNFVENIPNPTPWFDALQSSTAINHGTMIGGIIAAVGNNNEGIAGAGWKTKIMPLRVLNSRGVGDTRAIEQAIDYAILNGADILNLSFVGTDHAPGLEKAIGRAYGAGLVVVAAAGNDESGAEGVDLDETRFYPVCYDGPSGQNWTLGVIATDTLDQKTIFSNFGQRCVDIAAPGLEFYSTLVYSPFHAGFEKYYGGYLSGTSMAAALVSGVAALVKAVHPEYTNLEIYNAIKRNADNIDDVNPRYAGQVGWGRINAFRALEKKEAEPAADEVIAPAQKKESRFLVTADGSPFLKIFGLDGNFISEFRAIEEDFAGKISAVSRDLDIDGASEIVVGAGLGSAPKVRVFTSEGQKKHEFFAYAPQFKGGVNVAVGDLNGDGWGEIVTAPGPGGGPHIRIFGSDGRALSPGFFAYEGNMKEGVHIALGDIDRDGKDEIITVPLKKNNALVKIFKADGTLVAGFLAFPVSFRGGASVSVGDLNGDGWKEIVVGAGLGGGPQIRMFSSTGRPLSPGFFAYEVGFRGGISLAVYDIDGDGRDEIITAPGAGIPAEVRVFRENGRSVTQFYPLGERYDKGTNINH